MSEKYGKLEEGLLQALKAIDNQVARSMQRSPSEREAQGMQKWEPYSSRIEGITAFLLEEFGDNSINLDSLVVSTQAFAKALQLVCDDLGQEGLGKIRTEYCLDAMRKVARDAEKVIDGLSEQRLV
ncbi:MAG: hypothetical protein ACK5Y6_00185 [Pseudomonadota bacterium]|jgi:hypothetical protein